MAGNPHQSTVLQVSSGSPAHGDGRPLIRREGWSVSLHDNITITPGFFYLSRPQGQDTGPGGSFQSYGFLVQSTFGF